MELFKIYEQIDALAPFSLSKEWIERWGAYDNSGILLDAGEEILGALFSLDLTLSAVDEAKKAGKNLIITHHPAIYEPLKRVERGSPIARCMREGISVISAHLNLDAARGGIDESLMEALGGKREEKVMTSLSNGGYGRVFFVEETGMQELILRAREKLHAKRIVSYGDKKIRKIASFCGGGFDAEALEFAFCEGADVLVSSEGRHHLILKAAEEGMNVLLLTHDCLEEYGFYRFFVKMRERLNIDCAYHAEERFL